MGYVRWPNREARDAEILRLRLAGSSYRKIAALVGVDRETAFEVVNPGKRASYNTRRREYNTSPEGLERQRDYRARRKRIDATVRAPALPGVTIASRSVRSV
jgi:hypothetical protein